MSFGFPFLVYPARQCVAKFFANAKLDWGQWNRFTLGDSKEIGLRAVRPPVANAGLVNNTAQVAGIGAEFVDNIVAVSTTIRTLQYSNNTVGSSHNTLLDPGVTL